MVNISFDGEVGGPSSTSGEPYCVLGAPLNGGVEVAGPEQYRMDEFFRAVFAASNDPRQVVTDEHARYFGTELSERSLVPLGKAMLGKIKYADWNGTARTYPVQSAST